MSNARDRYKQLLNSSIWRQTRKTKLDRNPFCEDCARSGVITPACEVHHLIPVKAIADPDRQYRMTFDINNLASLCHDCHAERHKRMGKNTAEENLRRASSEAAVFCQRFYGEDPGADFLSTGEGS